MHDSLQAPPFHIDSIRSKIDSNWKCGTSLCLNLIGWLANLHCPLRNWPMTSDGKTLFVFFLLLASFRRKMSIHFSQKMPDLSREIMACFADQTQDGKKAVLSIWKKVTLFWKITPGAWLLVTAMLSYCKQPSGGKKNTFFSSQKPGHRPGRP